MNNEQTEGTREHRLGVLQTLNFSGVKLALMTSLVDGRSIPEAAKDLGITLSDASREIAESADMIAAVQHRPEDLTAAVAAHNVAMPQPHTLPDDKGWHAFRLPQDMKLNALEVWLLEHVGEGNSASYDMLEETDKWMLGLRAGYLTAWFKTRADYQHFVAVWFTPQVTSKSMQ